MGFIKTKTDPRNFFDSTVLTSVVLFKSAPSYAMLSTSVIDGYFVRGAHPQMRHGYWLLLELLEEWSL